MQKLNFMNRFSDTHFCFKSRTLIKSIVHRFLPALLEMDTNDGQANVTSQTILNNIFVFVSRQSLLS